MRIMVDLNVILDVLMNREPFVSAATRICDDCRFDCYVSAHLVTTAAYLARKINAEAQEATLDFILENFHVVPCDGNMLSEARALGFADYEDAVLAIAAKKARCKFIVTRNVRDFASSPILAMSPSEFLAQN